MYFSFSVDCYCCNKQDGCTVEETRMRGIFSEEKDDDNDDNVYNHWRSPTPAVVTRSATWDRFRIPCVISIVAHVDVCSGSSPFSNIYG